MLRRSSIEFKYPERQRLQSLLISVFTFSFFAKPKKIIPIFYVSPCYITTVGGVKGKNIYIKYGICAAYKLVERNSVCGMKYLGCIL